jgi:hypothetical protein
VSRRRLAAVGAVAIGIVLAVFWLVPMFGGPLMVSVRTQLVPVDDGGPGASVRLPDGSVANASGVRVDVVVTNRYPLPVVLWFEGPAFEATATPVDVFGGRSWVVTADDPMLEQTDDSPDLGSATRVATIDSGEQVIEITPGVATFDLNASGGRLLAGTYSVSARAFGVTAPPVDLVVLAPPAA